MSKINDNNIERFIINSFKKALKEWILDPKEIKLGKTIASGSTCKVVKGKYKNNIVAVKRIFGLIDAQKMKFLKEFKREVTLLISIPS